MAMEKDFDRTPPQDLEAESSVLGSMMLSKDAINDVMEILHDDDYYKPANGTIHSTIVDLSARGEPADAVTVAAELQRQGELTKIGGASYIHTLIASVPTAANAGYYARIVREQSLLRHLVSAGTRIVQLGYADAGGEVDEIINQAQAEIYAVSDSHTTNDYHALGELADDVLGELEEIERNGGHTKGVPTGFVDLDRITHGLHAGQMIIVAARPAMGKSTLALDFCREASIRQNVVSVIFSLEMSESEIFMRMLSAESNVPLRNMQSGKMSNDDWTRVSQTISNVSEKPLYIDDSPNMSINEIRAKCRKLKQKKGLGLVVIDYLQLMSSGKKVESRQQEVSEFSRQLKLLAKELELPVVAVCQLNRGPEQRTDKRPMMADLRESGSLEQDADIIFLLHRPDYYDRDDRPGEADIILAKHRNGDTAVIKTSFLGHVSHFANMAMQEEPGGI